MKRPRCELIEECQTSGECGWAHLVVALELRCARVEQQEQVRGIFGEMGSGRGDRSHPARRLCRDSIVVALPRAGSMRGECAKESRGGEARARTQVYNIGCVIEERGREGRRGGRKDRLSKRISRPAS